MLIHNSNRNTRDELTFLSASSIGSGVEGNFSCFILTFIINNTSKFVLKCEGVIDIRWLHNVHLLNLVLSYA
jgi:hypothetical protein